MANVTAYDTKTGKRYRVRYRKPDGSQTDKRGFKTQKEAKLYAANVEVKKATGDYIDPTLGKATIATLGEAWLAGRSHLKPSSKAAYESAWRLHVNPQWGTESVASIKHSAVQSWIELLGAGVEGKAKPKSPTIVRRSHDILAGILDAAVLDKRISSNPARKVKMPRRIQREHRYLTHEEVASLAKECGTNATLILTLAYTGLRWGEVTALRVSDLDMLRRRISIARNAVYVKGKTILGTPKTHEKRSVPFPKFLSTKLAKACEKKGRDDLVFPGPGGAFMITPTVRQNSWYDKALLEAKLPSMTIHDLRHTAASLAISSGANVKAIQRMMGHASAAMTLDTYGDLFDDDLDAVAVAVNKARAKAVS